MKLGLPSLKCMARPLNRFSKMPQFPPLKIDDSVSMRVCLADSGCQIAQQDHDAGVSLDWLAQFAALRMNWR